MSPRPTILMLVTALAVAIGPTLRGEGANDRLVAPDRRAEDQPTQQQRRTPPPPAGCPFRNGKLELIA